MLARSIDPTQPDPAMLLDVRSITGHPGLWELRDKGGILGSDQVRVFFGMHNEAIVVVGVLKKKRRRIPGPVLAGMARRLQNVRSGSIDLGH